MTSPLKHISVCICTYKRPLLLKRLLSWLGDQETGGLFTYSAVVVDNDEQRSAEKIVEQFQTLASMPVRYCVEPVQGIALARNRAVANAPGDYIAFIDDDEFPAEKWLLHLYRMCEEHQVAGVLGPIEPYFDKGTPRWVIKGKFYRRSSHPTGVVLDWKQTRTGNVLFKRSIIEREEPAFRPQFRAGEDLDFFRRMMDKGHRFIWCAEAVVYEVVPSFRWKHSVMLRRALLRGASAALQPTTGLLSITKSIVAILIYSCALPLSLLMGHRWWMTLLVKLCDHLGKVLAVAGINPIKDQYVTE